MRRFNRPRLEIKFVSKEEKIGFRIWSRGGTLHSPKVVYSTAPFRQEWRADSYPLILYDKDGNSYEKDYVLAGESICVFPFLAKHEIRKVRAFEYTLEVDMSHPFGHYASFKLSFGALKWRHAKVGEREYRSNVLTTETRKEMLPLNATLRFYADGWEEEQVYHFDITLNPMVFVATPERWGDLREEDIPEPNSPEWKVYYNGTLKRGREW
jgi:hypothetical protein